MSDYTTPEALKTAVLNAIANRDLVVLTYRRADGTSVTYRTVDEYRQALALCDELIAQDAAVTGVASRRTSTKFVSGGSW